MAAYRRRLHRATANSRTKDGRRRRRRPRVVPRKSAPAQNAREGLAARLNDFTMARLRDRSHNRSLDNHWSNNINFAGFFAPRQKGACGTLAAPPAFLFKGSTTPPASPRRHNFAVPQSPLPPRRKYFCKCFYCRYSDLRNNWAAWGLNSPFGPNPAIDACNISSALGFLWAYCTQVVRHR